MANLQWAAFRRFVAALLEIGCIIGIKVLFSEISPIMTAVNPPDFISISLECFRLGLSTIEGVFIVFSAGISILIIIARRSTTEGIWKPLKEFLLESIISAATMGLMFLVAAGVGWLNPKGSNTMESWENWLIIVVLVGLFYSFGLGFVVLPTNLDSQGLVF